MDEAGLRSWFDGYLRTFERCGRGEEADLRVLTAHYGVPLLFSTDDAAVTLTSEAEVLAALGRQVDGMRAAGYARSELLDARVAAVNATSALLTARFSRRRADGSELGRLEATYLIVAGGHGRRIAALLVHAA